MIQNNKINSQKKIIFNFIIFYFFIFLLGYFIILPSIKNIYVMGQNINELRSDLEEKYIKGQNLKQININLRQIEPNIGLLDQGLLEQGDEFGFVSNLEDLANQKNVDFKINLGEPKKINQKNYATMPITITANGSYLNLLKFIYSLENLNYYINIENLEISSNQSAENANFLGNGDSRAVNDLNLTITALTYWK